MDKKKENNEFVELSMVHPMEKHLEKQFQNDIISLLGDIGIIVAQYIDMKQYVYEHVRSGIKETIWKSIGYGYAMYLVNNCKNHIARVGFSSDGKHFYIHQIHNEKKINIKYWGASSVDVYKLWNDRFDKTCHKFSTYEENNYDVKDVNMLCKTHRQIIALKPHFLHMRYYYLGDNGLCDFSPMNQEIRWIGFPLDENNMSLCDHRYNEKFNQNENCDNMEHVLEPMYTYDISNKKL